MKRPWTDPRKRRFFPDEKTAINKDEQEARNMYMPPEDHPPVRRRKRRWGPRRVWNIIVMTIGYLAIAYNVIRGIIYLLVLAEEWM